jgi:anti-repressor protein
LTDAFTPSLSLRAVEINGDPWFIAKDVCAALDTRVDNISAIIDADEFKPLLNSGSPGRAPLIVSESGLYALIMRSRKPEAKTFRKWVTSVVLPAIWRVKVME